MFRKYTAEFHLQMFGGAIVGALRRRYFPIGEITGRMLSAPTQMVPPNYRRENFGALKDTLYQHLMFS